MSEKCRAKEAITLDEVIASLTVVYMYAELRMNRLKSLACFPDGTRLLDIGAAQGEYVAAYQKLGFSVVGVEPWDEARRTATRLSEYLDVPIDIREGRAEELPFDDDSFDIVLATSVLEHVEDLETSISEIYRVLRPGGLFWFNSASSLCPRTSEITSFPLFGWYPNRLKLKIMNWAKVNRPELVGHTEYPAINWFTPWKARRILKKHGFRKVYDRWDVSRAFTENGIKSSIFRIIAMGSATKFLADVFRRGCNYTAIK